MRDRGSLRGPLVPDEVLIGRAVNQVACGGEKEGPSEHEGTRDAEGVPRGGGWGEATVCRLLCGRRSTESSLRAG